MLYIMDRREFISDEADMLKEWTEETRPGPGMHRVGLIQVQVTEETVARSDVDNNWVRRIEFVGRQCETCLSGPGEPCHPDCPELG